MRVWKVVGEAPVKIIYIFDLGYSCLLCPSVVYFIQIPEFASVLLSSQATVIGVLLHG